MQEAASGRRNPWVFVVGCPRSGTTMLQRMLDNHPQLAVANDSHFIPQPIEEVPLDTDPPLTSDLVSWVRTFRRIPRLGLPDGSVDRAADGAATYGEFVSGLYDELARSHGKPLAGEKTGGYIREMPRLHALFPWARFIHIIRDGRDVALSTRDWATGGKGPSKLELWAEDPIAVSALWWRRNVLAGRRDAGGLARDLYREVLYEDLVGHPEPALRELAAFLDLPDSPQMARYHVGRTQHQRGLSSKKAWLPPTPGLRNWRADLTETEQAMFEALAGDVLADLGYERRYDSPPAGISERAERFRTWWDATVTRRDARRTAMTVSSAPEPR